MAELILSPFLQDLFNKLTSKAEITINRYLQKRKKRKELPETIQKWIIQLEDIEIVLSDAEQKRVRFKSVDKWLQDLQDWAYDLEDILDEFATDARLNELHQEEEEDDSQPSCYNGLPRTKVPGASDLNSGAYSTRIEKISSRLESILERKKTLKLLAQTPPREERLVVGTTSIPPRQVFGREKEKQSLIDQILVDEPRDGNYTVIAVVGQGGIGKTTFIQSVYHDEQLKDHFKVKAWVCVSDVFDTKQITTAIIKSADPENCSSATFDNLNEAQTKLCEILREKRFLIALDDVWNDKYNPWEQLQLPFLEGLEGSIVLVTTRDDNVAKNMLTTPAQNFIVHLDGLSDDECWLIFKQHALISDDPIETRDEVIKLSKGLPLAAKALGGLLKKKERDKWSTILSNGIWSEEGGVLPALRLSYYHLPQHLKRIFAYCSVFPQDHNFDKYKTVLMWMAEGFLPESEEESMEDKGNSYFDDLVSRSLFDPISYRKGKFIMHDLINDLAQWAAGDVCCRMKIKKKIPSRTRYLSVTREVSNQDPSFLENVGDAGRQLRSYVHLSRSQSKVLESSLLQFQCLRVLYLADMGFTKLPDSIGNLKHLRFLDLSDNKQLEHLPESMSKLCNLQTLLLCSCAMIKKLFDMSFLTELRHLNIRDMGFTKLPDSIGNLKHLRFLDLSDNEQLEHLPESMSKLCNLQTLLLENCSKLKKLFDMSFLIELRHLNITFTGLLEMPLGIGKLTNLRTLTDYSLAASSGCRIRELGNLKYLSNSLSIDGLQFVKSEEDAKMARLHEKSHLEELRFCYTEHNIPDVDVDYSFEKGVLNQLQPPDSIKKLSLYDYKASAFPDWLGDPSFNKMVVIMMSDCSRCEWLPPLGQLPSLKQLELCDLDGIKRVGPEFYGTGFSKAFPALKTLYFSEMKNWEEWITPFDEDGRPFPLLEKLVIFRCPLLQGNIPSYLPSLKILKIDDTPEIKVSLPSCPLLQELKIRGGCRELSSIKSVICCSRIVDLESISSFSGVEGFSVPDVVTITVDNHVLPDLSQPYIRLMSCPKLLSWRPQVDGELHKLTQVIVSNCELLDLWFQNESLPSVNYLRIDGDEFLNDVSTVTKPFTCLECLKISYCKALRITANNYLPLTLRKLILLGVEIEQPAKEWGLDRLLTSLEHLQIESVYINNLILDRQDSCLDAVELIPDDLPLPSSLVTIHIRGFKNLKSFSCSTLHNLSQFSIKECPLMSKECVYGGQCKLQRLQVNDLYWELQEGEWIDISREWGARLAHRLSVLRI